MEPCDLRNGVVLCDVRQDLIEASSDDQLTRSGEWIEVVCVAQNESMASEEVERKHVYESECAQQRMLV